MTFNVGNVVVVKSGGLPMTVEDVIGSDVICTWMSSSGVKMTEVFKVSCLEVQKVGRHKTIEEYDPFD